MKEPNVPHRARARFTLPPEPVSEEERAEHDRKLAAAIELKLQLMGKPIPVDTSFVYLRHDDPDGGKVLSFLAGLLVASIVAVALWVLAA